MRKKEPQQSKLRKFFRNLNLNRFWIGLLLGASLPLLFIWLYLNRFYPFDMGFLSIIKALFPSVILGKLLILSIVPNLIGVFIFYKKDNFKLGISTMIGGLPYLAMAMFMI